jgi:hypothetical protein
VCGSSCTRMHSLPVPWGPPPCTDIACMRRYAFEYPAGWKVETVGKVRACIAENAAQR